MATVVLNGKLTRPDLAEQAQSTGFIEIVDISTRQPVRATTSTNETIFGPQNLNMVAGVWSVTVYGNADLSPANTMYHRRYFLPGGATEDDYYVVPAGGGPYQEKNLMTLTPLPVPATSTQVIPNLRTSSPPTWTPVTFSTDPSVAATTALTYEHGQVVIRGSGAGTGVRSNLRMAYKIPGSPGGYSRIRSRLSGRTYATGLLPQRGHIHGAGVQVDGKLRGAVVWHDIIFDAAYVLNLGIWEANQDGSGFSVLATPALTDFANVSAAARTSNVVTLTVPSGHGFQIDDVVAVDLSDNSYDGTFVVSSVTATTVVYAQTAANAGTSTGTVKLIRNDPTKTALIRQTASTDAVRSSGVVTATVGANHPFQVGDWMMADYSDNTYDGTFVVTELPSTTQIRWRQGVADDASAGSGTITKHLPYWMESEWLPGVLRVRVWPDSGVANGASGPIPAGPPPWESSWSSTLSLTPAGASSPDPAYGTGCYLIGAHLATGSTVTEVRYDSVVADTVSV